MKFFQHGSQRWHHQHPLQHGGVSVHFYDLIKEQFFLPTLIKVLANFHYLKMHTHNQPVLLTLVLIRYDEGTICTVSGWGTTTEGGSLARVLQKVNMVIMLFMLVSMMLISANVIMTEMTLILRSTSPLCLTSTAVTPTDRATSPTP